MNFYVSYRYVEQTKKVFVYHGYCISLYLSALPQYVSNASVTTAKRKLSTLKYTLCCFVCSHKIIK